MKRLMLLLWLLAVAGYAGVYRPVTQVNDITDLDPYKSSFTVWQGDTVQFDVYARNVRTAMNFSGAGVFPVWYIGAMTNYATVYLVATGSVITATNGHVRVTVVPSNTVLAATNYWSQMRVYCVTNNLTS